MSADQLRLIAEASDARLQVTSLHNAAYDPRDDQKLAKASLIEFSKGLVY